MSNSDEYQGYSNVETFMASVNIDNDQGLYLESRRVVRDAVRSFDEDDDGRIGFAADALREWLTDFLDPEGELWAGPNALSEWSKHARPIAEDIGSLHRVDWRELAEGILSE